MLDIGCGHGFDDSSQLQHSLAERAEILIGVEPDPQIQVPEYFDEVYTCFFEDAKIPPSSVDVAFAVMVLEHLAEPCSFWSRLSDVLAPGGVFWGFTMDDRHYFTTVSRMLDQIGLKDLVLSVLHGERGEDRYENYPTYYRANTPRAIHHQTVGTFDVTCLNLACTRDLDFYFPRITRPLSHAIEWTRQQFGLPGSILAIRLQKR